jgi:hypothetical protein
LIWRLDPFSGVYTCSKEVEAMKKTPFAILLTLTAIAVVALPATVSAGGDSVLEKYFSNIEVGKPHKFENLTVFPILLVSRGTTLNYTALDDALSAGDLVVKEVAQEEVNVVEAKNEGNEFVYGMTGEVILGAKQDRMLESDILFPPKSDWIRIPVYCTERGRWRFETKSFAASGFSVPTRVRQRAVQGESQSGVWGQISEYSAQFKASAPTEALGDILETEEVKADSKPYVKEFEDLPAREPQAVGVVVVAGGTILVADVFGSHELFSELWKKLLRSYIVDAIGVEQKGRVTKKAVQAFVKEAATGEFRSRATPGVGEVFSITGKKLKGSALTHRDAVVHLDLFPYDPEMQGEGGYVPRLDERRIDRTRDSERGTRN